MPSRSSEFAHPDVLIGLSILAYRYEGLRLQDLKRLVKQLKKDYSRQVGNKSERPACILFEQWKAMGRGRIMQERLRTAKNDAQDARDAAEGESKGESKGNDSKGDGSKGAGAGLYASEAAAAEAAAKACLPLEANDKIQRVGLDVLTLPLFQPDDDSQLQRLSDLISGVPEAIEYYLRQHVFPDCMNFQTLKISACGHALGSEMLFGTRIGFSGTPSSLLPSDLGTCQYELGSDGKYVRRILKGCYTCL